MSEKLSQGPRIGQDLSKVGAGLSRGPNMGKKLPAAPWSGTWPAPGSTLDLDFANNRGWVRGVGQGGVMDAITFTRASTGQYIDSTGLLQAATDHVPRFDWASTARVVNKNLLSYTEQFSATAWSTSALSISSDSTTAPDGSNTADKLIESATSSAHYVRQQFVPELLAGRTYVASLYVKDAGRSWCVLQAESSYAYFDISGVAVGNTSGVVSAEITDVGSGWRRCVVVWVGVGGTQRFNVFPASANGINNYLGDGSSGVYVWGAQAELGSSATTYQPIAQPTTNTPLAANPTCNGILIEESRANRLLWCRDATQSGSWTCTNVTPLLDQTGIDGVANSASSLTASADGGTCIQTITLASGSRTGSVYLKRITGTGNVQVSLDGSTWSTVDLSSTEWRRIVLSGTVTNPTVGIKLSTNGDAVAMDYGQVEDGTPATTPILTTTASATRATEVSPSVRMIPGLHDFLTRDRVSGVFSNSQTVTGSRNITANTGIRYVTRLLAFATNYLKTQAKTLMGVAEA